MTRKHSETQSPAYILTILLFSLCLQLYMEAYRLSIQAYGECSILTSRINFNIGTMYEDRQEYYEAYNWFVEAGETYEKVCCIGGISRTQDLKIVRLNPVWSCLLYSLARHFTRTSSS